MKSYRLLIFLLLVCCLTGCTRQQAPSPTETPTTAAPTLTATTIPATAEITPAIEATPTENPVVETSDLAYQLDASLDYAEHSITITQFVDYANTTGGTLSELPLVIPPVLTATEFTIFSVTYGAGFEGSSYVLNSSLMQISLSPALENGERLTFTLIYRMSIPESQTAFGYTDRQLLLSDWYAFIPPYLPDEGWLINQPGYVGEYLAYPLADFTVNLRLSPPMESLVVAASAPLVELDGNCWRYAAKQVRNFSLAISPEYQYFSIASDLVTINAYVFPEHADLASRSAMIALEAWALYSELYGENPRQFMSIIEADLTDGLECDGLFYLSDGYFASADDTPQNYYHLLVAHETAHQWFYGMVPNNQALEPWLDESLTAYSELLYLERYYPNLVDWWWRYRVQAFAPTGAVNSTIYDFLKSRPYINAVYLRGVTFQQALRDAVGDDAYFAALRSYSDSSQGDIYRDSEAFFDAFQSVSDVDFSKIVARYFN